MNHMFRNLKNDIPAGLVVFLVALPLCLGIALASGAPLFSGIITGIVGGLVVSMISGSPVSISGPAAALSAIVLQSITDLKTFEIFLLAVVISGIMQLFMGILKFGVLANYIPSSVIKGTLASIGMVLILKQIPHIFGYDHDTEGDFTFLEYDGGNTFSEIYNILGNIDIGATIIGFVSIGILLLWDKPFISKFTKTPAPLVVVLVGIIINQVFALFGGAFSLKSEHLVNIPVSDSIYSFFGQFRFPDFSAWHNPKVYLVALTLAIVASIETLLSLEAADKLDLQKRYSPTNRELVAQGVGNTLAGLIGGIPMSSVIVRTSVNINAGAQSQMASFVNGLLLLSTAMFIPSFINLIPLSALGAILLFTGYKLTNLSLLRSIYSSGKDQFIPFSITIVTILFTDLLTGIIVGLFVSTIVILKNNMENSYSFKKEKYYIDETIKFELSDQVSFLNKASILLTLDHVPKDAKIIIDASKTSFIDYDVLEIFREFKDNKAPSKNIQASFIGFNEKFDIPNNPIFTLSPTKEIQQQLTPTQVFNLLKDGNNRFSRNQSLNRDFSVQIKETSDGQYPIAAVLSCIDSRTSAEYIFDQGIGEVFSIRLAGNIANEDILGSMEFACKVAGAKLIVILGHKGCGAIKAACDNVKIMKNLNILVDKIRVAVTAETETQLERNSSNKQFLANVTHINVQLTIDYIKDNSAVLNEMIANGEIGIVGGVYDISNGQVEFTEVYIKETVTSLI